MEPDQELTLKREIGGLGFSAITLNGLIGGGIFALPALAAASTGYFSPWMFLICGLLFLTVVLSFAKAASLFRRTGGPIVYATHAFGAFAGFQTGWLLYLGRISAMAANTNLLVTYAGWFWPALGSGFVRALAIALVCVCLTGLNVIGVRRGMLTVYVLTLLKLIPLSLVVVLGLAHVSPELLLAAELPTPGTFGETILLLLYAYIGFEGAVVPAGEARSPRKDIPRALIGTVIVVAVFYFLIQLASVATMPEIGTSSTPLADVAHVLMGPAGAALLTLGAVLSIGGNISALMLAAPRMTYALARDGSLPGWFSRVHPLFHTPGNSIVFLGLLALALALSGSFVWLAVMSTLARLLGYAVCIASLPRLGRGRESRFQLPGGYSIPAIALVLCLWLMTQASIRAWLTTLAFVALGTALYVFARGRQAG